MIATDDDSVVARVFRTGEPASILCCGKGRMDPIAEAEGVQSLCHIPLISRNRTLGLLSLARLAPVPFSPRDLEFLTLVGNQVAIAVENALAYHEIAELKDRLAQEKVYLEDEIRSELNFDEIVGRSSALRSVLQEIETVAPTDSTVLIYGETGTGKELIARAIHNLSGRAKNSFVKLNCAAIPTGLLESEMFGHEKGAFTGAVAQRIGRFELAHHGTVFLDEIGEIPLELQPKLLRVLQEREFERLGSSRTLRTDARLIAATNRDLTAMVEERSFRADLFYRLNVFPVQVPPLRDRLDDIPLLVRHFVQQFARRMSKVVDTIPTETMNALVHYHWPGNIRELQNLVERAVILSTGPTLKVPIHDLQAQPMPSVARKIETMEEERSAGTSSRRSMLPGLGDQRSGRRGLKARFETQHTAGSHGQARSSPRACGGSGFELAMSREAYAAARAISPKLHAYLARHQEEALARGEKCLAPLPDAETIEAVIDASFWASLRREEGLPTEDLAGIPLAGEGSASAPVLSVLCPSEPKPL